MNQKGLAFVGTFFVWVRQASDPARMKECDMPQYWLMKSEPDEYGWAGLVAEREGTWDGVKNAQAAGNMRAMKKGDQVFFYHSRQGLEMGS